MLELQKQRLLDEDRQNAANSALDRLFARRRILHDVKILFFISLYLFIYITITTCFPSRIYVCFQEEERLTAELDEEAKHARQQQILEARHKMLEQSNKERETELKEYLGK